MTARKPPRLMRSGLTGRVYVITAYKVLDEAADRIEARTKHDVTADFEALVGDHLDRALAEHRATEQRVRAALQNLVAAAETVGGNERYWPRDMRLEGSADLLEAALDAAIAALDGQPDHGGSS